MTMQDKINERARIFGYACDPKEWKSFTPIHRMEGFKAGAKSMEKLIKKAVYEAFKAGYSAGMVSDDTRGDNYHTKMLRRRLTYYKQNYDNKRGN